MLERLGHYKVVRELGSGAMGTVYEGLDESLSLRVAIKVLSQDIVANPENLARFEREARAAALLKHPNIAHVFFVGRTQEGMPFYVMEYIEGYSLSDVIKKRMILKGAQQISIMQQTLSALKLSGEKGILHRDVKPGNIMIDERDGAKLVDFGIAKLTEGDIDLTRTGTALGTPKYISPEQAQGKKTDFRADMYSLGITFWEMVAGNAPYTSDTPVGIIMKHVQAPVPDLHESNQQYPRALCRTIEKMIAKKPEDRFAAYDEIISELDAVAMNESLYIGASWTYCETCRTNVMIIAVKNERACNHCRTPFDPPEEEETFMAVRLMGFAKPDAIVETAKFLSRFTKQKESLLLKLLEKLPAVLSPRLSLTVAKNLQKNLFELGAMIDLEKVGTEKIKTGTERQTLRLSTSGRYALISGDTGTTGKKAANPSAPRKPLSPWILKGFLVLAVALGAIWFGGPVLSWVREAISSASSGAGGDDQNAYVDPVGNGYFLSPARKCAFSTKDLDNKAFLTALGRTCDEMALEVQKAVEGPDSVKPILIKAVLYGNGEFSEIAPSFGLGLPEDAGRIQIQTKGAKPDDAEFKAVLAALIARHLFLKSSNSRVPEWFETGWSLVYMRKVIPEAFHPDSHLSRSDGYLEGEEWNGALKEKSQRAYAQAASFCEYLSRPQFSRVIEAFNEDIMAGKDPDETAKTRFGKDFSHLMQDWFDTIEH